MNRDSVTKAERIVIKIGSSSLTGRSGGTLDRNALDSFVDLIASLIKRGKEVVVVSSGAIATGLAPLGLTSRPKDLALQQAAASVGQGLLIRNYSDSFSRHGLLSSQVLLTLEDVVRRSHYKNVQSTLAKLLELGVIPIINENDSVGVAEIKFGDNDRISALVSHIVKGDLLVLISDVDALYDSPPDQSSATVLSRSAIRTVRDFDEIAAISLTGVTSKVGSGGMITKVEAARIATSAGVTTLLTNLESASLALSGQEVGTIFLAREEKMSSRLFWLAHASTSRGRLVLDAGAVKAIRERGTSLLAAGVTQVEGEFSSGDTVDLVDQEGQAIARGIVAFDSDEIPKILGRSTKDLAKEFGPEYERELVHRDEMVLL
ncbi:MAG: glutamate 5-kinase [Actinomycetota bacterium]